MIAFHIKPPYPALQAILLTAATSVSPVSAYAAEWSLNPSVTAKAGYNDNFRMSTANELTVRETSLAPELMFARTTETSRMAGTVGFNFRRYDEDGIDTNDRFLNFNASRNTSPLNQLGLDIGYRRDTTLDTELDDTGVVLDRSPRTSWTLSPRWTRTINEKTRLNTSYRFTDVSYSQEQQTNLADYQLHSINADLGYRISARTVISPVLGLSRYKRDDGLRRTDNASVSLLINHDFSERLAGFASVGARHSSSTTKDGFPSCSGILLPGILYGSPGTVCVDPVTLNQIPFDTILIDQDHDTTGTLFSGGVEYRMETGSVSLEASRSINPSGNNGLVENDQLRLEARHKFSEKLSGSLNIAWYQSTNADDLSIGRLDRKFLTVNPGLTWNLKRNWSLAANYRYRKQSYESASQDASSNIYNLSLSYTWPRMAISR